MGLDPWSKTAAHRVCWVCLCRKEVGGSSQKKKWEDEVMYCISFNNRHDV
ncbi:hypothetical protein BDA96_09G178300 [Sorghum bicolor]|uniref:Uncharacterized protein n=1 Tax=Sorghum bicolor TaxID=4558 RepID=A0A921QB59_SORBI|nr:hypothetical protein BDA96_09G178300 [Sorghum bicolor]